MYSLLPVLLITFQVNKNGLKAACNRLMGQRVWFNLISHDPDQDVLNVYIRPVKVSLVQLSGKNMFMASTVKYKVIRKFSVGYF